MAPSPSRVIPPPILKKIFAYIYGRRTNPGGLVQPQDKIVDRCALTIYPYSLYLLNFKYIGTIKALISLSKNKYG